MLVESVREQVCVGEELRSSSRQQLHVCESVSVCSFLNESKRSEEESVQ